MEGFARDDPGCLFSPKKENGSGPVTKPGVIIKKACKKDKERGKKKGVLTAGETKGKMFRAWFRGTGLAAELGKGGSANVINNGS